MRPDPHRRAELRLAAQRLRAPATIANTSRNACAEPDRHGRWAPARDALWNLLDPLLATGARVAVLGAGNGDDLPLRRIADRAGQLALIDLDARAGRAARRRQPRRLRARIDVIHHDVTGGAADLVAIAAARADTPIAPEIADSPLPGSPYDLVIGDLLYSQLLYPALCDLGLPAGRVNALLAHHSPILTQAVVSRLHRSAPGGRVVHIHDPIAWWPAHPQPFGPDDLLTISERHPDAALQLAARGTGPHDSDPRIALVALAIPVQATALWRWPFAADVDYVACATVADGYPGLSPE
jgi:hypothetical protein